MAIYHVTAKIVSRKKGQSVVACACYRAAEELYDERLGQKWDYTRKRGVAHCEILAPPQALGWMRDRGALWNAVERAELRKDAQLAREIEIGLPVELTQERQIELLRDFVKRTFVEKGMVADAALHRDNPENPHAHVLLTLRQLTPEGFGWKRRDWNAKENLLQWRAQWAQVANEHLARAGLDIRIDHRTLEAQGIDLVPGRKLGLSVERQRQPGLPRNLAERVAEQRAIAAENGRRIINDPRIALRALTHMQGTFALRDVGKFLHGRTDGVVQFDAAYLKVTTSPELVVLGDDEGGGARFTTRGMLEVGGRRLERGRRLGGVSEQVGLADIDAVQQRAAERWLAKQQARELGLSGERQVEVSHGAELDKGAGSGLGEEKNRHQGYRGPEDELDI